MRTRALRASDVLGVVGLQGLLSLGGTRRQPKGMRARWRFAHAPEAEERLATPDYISVAIRFGEVAECKREVEDALRYTFDLGSGWQHEGVLPAVCFDAR